MIYFMVTDTFRQEFLVSKVIRNQADENEEDFHASSAIQSFALHDHDDDDWTYISKDKIPYLKQRREKYEWGTVAPTTSKPAKDEEEQKESVRSPRIV